MELVRTMFWGLVLVSCFARCLSCAPEMASETVNERSSCWAGGT